MEHTSRTERYRRERSRSKRRARRRLATSAVIVAFFALACMLWISYNGGMFDRGTGLAGTGDEHAAGNGGAGTALPGGTDKGADAADASPSESHARPGDGDEGGKTGTASGKPDDAGTTPAAGSPGTQGGQAGDAEAAMDDPERVHITFTGDVIFAGNVEAVLRRNGYDFPYKHVRPFLEDADLTVANLETPITERGEAAIKEYAYRSSPKALPDFRQAGFDVVNLANNHILDYGTVGLLDTFDHLDKAGIQWFGAGRDIDEAFRPVILDVKGTKIAFLGFSKVVPTESWKAGNNHPGVADTYALKKPLEAIRNAKKQADLVIVVVHWGVERQDTPEKYQKDFAREYIDAGADLVVGGHPHVLQGFESYKEKWIAYSLGNFIFTMNENPKTWETVILQASCSKTDGCALRAVPVLTRLADPQPMAAEEASKLYRRLTDISFGAEIGEGGIVRNKSASTQQTAVLPNPTR